MNNQYYLEFEKPLIEIKNEIKELLEKEERENLKFTEKIKELELNLKRKEENVYSSLTPYQIVQIARHLHRPHTLDYINLIFDDFLELHGDRKFGDDKAIAGGIAKLRGKTVMIVGHQKGSNTEENIYRNFGMPHPEGYRKALRIMKLAEKWNVPLITFVDTPGAYPGIGAEERGQAEAIAENLREMSLLNIPTISVIIGEGGSGGALALALTDRILMLKYSIFSVISPEGCAAILWRDENKKEEAAISLRLTSEDLFKLGIIDRIIPEPLQGAHTDWQTTKEYVEKTILEELESFKKTPDELRNNLRQEKYTKIGKFKG